MQPEESTNPGSAAQETAESPALFKDVLTTEWKFSEEVCTYIIHGIAGVDADATAKDGLAAVRRYVTSIGTPAMGAILLALRCLVGWLYCR